MTLQILGINHASAPVAIREQVVIPEYHLADALLSLNKVDGVCSGVIVSTCNRTELYCETVFDDITPVSQWLVSYHQLQTTKVTHCLYDYQETEAIRHLLRVASGLDSMVLGEPQILGQLKTAYQIAADNQALTVRLDRLFQHTFSAAKKVRSQTGINSSPISVAYAVLVLVKQIFTDLAKQTVLLLGAGATSELIARYLHYHQIGCMIIANRNYDRAHYLSRQFDGYAIELAAIPEQLAKADIVITSTASPKPLITFDQAKQAIDQRKRRPMLMIDIALPRDIDPAIEQLEDIYLYGIDDMQAIVQDNLKSRQVAATKAQEMIEEQVRQFIHWVQSRDAVPTICDLRHVAKDIQAEVIAKAKRQIAQGKPAELVIEWLAHSLTNKLTHRPYKRLHQAGLQQEQMLIKAARQLFDLDGLEDKK